MATQKGKRTGRSNRELSQQTKHELLAVGAREFFNHPSAANPFRGLTLDRIARLAGKSRNTVYLHWQDKDAYLADLTRYLLGDPAIFEKDFEMIQDVARKSAGMSALDALCAVANTEVATPQGQRRLARDGGAGRWLHAIPAGAAQRGLRGIRRGE